MKSGIYEIINLANNKFYIGSAVDMFHRWQTHEWRLNQGTHGNKHLQAAFDKYGYENFKFKVLEYCEKDQLAKLEQFWIDWTRACELGYNIRKDATSNAGVVRSEEVRARQRIAMTGLRHSEASLEKMRLAQSNRSEATRRKLSQSKMGHPVSQETRNKIALSNLIKKRYILPDVIAFFEANKGLIACLD